LLGDDEQAEVDLAIKNGKNYLKQAQNLYGSWGAGDHPIGYTALSALALIECGMPPKDPCIQKAAAWLFANPDRLGKLQNTYELALVIFFLDALGDTPGNTKKPPFVPPPAVRQNAIVTMAMRLIAGQSVTGGWGYSCPILQSPDQTTLKRILKQRMDQAQGDDSPGNPKNIKNPPAKKEKIIPVPFSMANMPVLIPANRLPWTDLKGTETDNSNTQFAMLGLWVSRRYQVPIGPTFNLVMQRFRKSQNDDGGWQYRFVNGGGGGSAPAMSCCALIGLAASYALGIDDPDRGRAKDARGAIKGAKPADDEGPQRRYGGITGSRCIKFSDGVDPDPTEKVKAPADQTSMIKGFTFVSHSVGKPVGKMKDLPMQNLYFLWSLERVAVLYNLRELGDRDWYRWAAEILVANQDPSGAWEKPGGYHGQSPILNTCFALLILKRANLAMDLTKKLPFEGSMLAAEIRNAAPPPPMPEKTVPVPQPTPAPQPPPQPTPMPVRTPAPVVQQPTPAPEPEPEKNNTSFIVGMVVAGVALALLIAAGIIAYMVLSKDDDDEDRPRKKKKKDSDSGEDTSAPKKKKVSKD
jgi:hypothetical protein